MTTPRLTSVWVAMQQRDAERQVAAERIGRAQPHAEPAPDEHDEERDDDRRADEAQLLADDGEDEVRVRLGQVEELLPRLADARARSSPPLPSASHDWMI